MDHLNLLSSGFLSPALSSPPLRADVTAQTWMNRVYRNSISGSFQVMRAIYLNNILHQNNTNYVQCALLIPLSHING